MGLKEEILGLLVIVSPFIILLTVTGCCFKNNCSKFNFFIYLFFNLAMIVILILPAVVIFDYYIYFQEFLKISENSEYEGIKQNIKYFYKAVHYIFYILADLVIPFCKNFYLLHYSQKEYKMSLTFFKGLLFFLLFIIVSTIVIVVCIIFCPAPQIDDAKKNCGGWDGILFNLRNAISFGQLEYYIMLFALDMAIRGMVKFSIIIRLINKSQLSEESIKFYTYWKIGKLIKEEEKDANSNDELKDIELKLKEMKKERKNDLLKKLKDDLSNKLCIIKYLIILINIPLGLLMHILGGSIFFFEMYNSLDGVSKMDYSNLKSDWEKNEEDHEKIKSGINNDLFVYSIFSYIYIIMVIYTIFQRKFYKEYLPYMGGKHNGFGFLILLKFILERVISINYTIFFPFITRDHKAIFQSYFELYSFCPGYKWLALVIRLLFFILPCIQGIFHCYRKGSFLGALLKLEDDDYVKEGIYYSKHGERNLNSNNYYALNSSNDSISNGDNDNDE